MAPFDQARGNPKKAANIVLITPGESRIYYGDETARSLIIEGTEGDATLRSFMNWEELDSLPKTKEILSHWQKLGTFRNDHPAIGAGIHKRITKTPYVFSRYFSKDEYVDKVVIGLDLAKGKKTISVKGIFGDGTKLYDRYSETEVTVENNKVILDNENEVALLELLN